MRMRHGTIAIALMILAASLGCGGKEARRDKELTERQRDSIIATEKALPGSDVVGRALTVSDSSAAQSRRMDQQAAGDAPAEEGK